MKQKCKCPFCESELALKCLEPVFCKPCGIALIQCKNCGKLFNKKSTSCPECKKAAER